MEIAVPFLSVPTKKSLKRQNFANINVAAIILAGIVAIGGTFLGGAARIFKGDSFFNGKPWFRTNKKKNKQKRAVPSDHDEYYQHVLNNIDDSLMEIDFDILGCTQRSVCWHIKNSLMNVKEEKARSIDRFVAGIMNSKWIIDMMKDTMWSDAIEAARDGRVCEDTFSKCALNPNNLEKFTKKIRQHAKPKKSVKH